MQTNISEQFLSNPDIMDAEAILRSCVHCGFCTATCPTYQLLGDELDSPRGRIYLIKQVLEGNELSSKTQSHLDRCLTCRSCETTCPSGVRYGRLVEIGREIVDQQVPRNLLQTVTRILLRKIVPYPRRFARFYKLGLLFRPLLPATLKRKLPVPLSSAGTENITSKRKMLVLQGCVQSVVTPQTNQAASRILQKLGIELISAPDAGCCGAVSHHLSAAEEGLDFMRRNIDAWWPYIESEVEQGVEAIIITASGCGTVVKDYAELLKHDPQYTDKAKKVSALAKDVSEILRDEDLSTIVLGNEEIKVAFHSPCTLQHGQKLNGVVEKILSKVGFTLTPVVDPHLCCGSAGTYSILQAELSQQLLDNKLSSLQSCQPDIIATANIGCQMHMASKATVPVKHWLEVIDEHLAS
ncbi:MAG: glycolate oxidase subunit GlcF [Gammaproteobacteria bacterium]|nr:glycolate oxidase subunit GlcF [Gammaproteobacteria bacterium]NNJ49929.1 glycolate oxidase subunit GlcF [Gammaproteobacteria bacterium]